MKIILWILTWIFTFFRVHSQLFPHIIWIYNANGYKETARFQKLCIQRINTLHKEKNWKIKFLDKNSIKKWLNEANYNYFQRILGYNQIAFQHQVDLLKYFLLKQHGGVWMDKSILLYQNLNWLDNLLNNSYIIHSKTFKNPEVFQFSTIQDLDKYQREKKMIYYQGNQIHPLLTLDNSFIAAKKQSKFINDVLQQYNYLIRDRKKRFDSISINYNLEQEYSQNSLINLATTIVLYRKFQEFQIKISLGSSIQENINNLYQILLMNKNKALYHIEEKQEYYRYFFQPQGHLFGNVGMYMRKFNSQGQLQTVQQVLDRNPVTTLKNQLKNKEYLFWFQYFTSNYSCLQQFVLHQQSIINKYLLQNNEAARKVFPDYLITNETNLPYICRITNIRQIKQVFSALLIWPFYTIIIILLSEFIVEFFVFSFKNHEKYLYQKKEHSKSQIWRKFLILITIYGQKSVIYNQYHLWLIQSPSTYLPLFFMILWTIIMFKMILINSSSFFSMIQNKYFELYFCLIVIFQYLLEYNNTIWKYEGQVFNYSNIQRENIKTIQQSQKFLIKTLLIVFIYQVFILIKKIFNLKYFSSRKNKGQQPFSIQILISHITSKTNCLDFQQKKLRKNEVQEFSQPKKINKIKQDIQKIQKATKKVTIQKGPSPQSQSLLIQQTDQS